MALILSTLVSRNQTQTDAQGLIACSISARAVRVWATDTAKFVLATTQNCEGVDWLKGQRHLWMFMDCCKILNAHHVFLKKWLLYAVAFVSKHRIAFMLQRNGSAYISIVHSRLKLHCWR